MFCRVQCFFTPHWFVRVLIPSHFHSCSFFSNEIGSAKLFALARKQNIPDSRHVIEQNNAFFCVRVPNRTAKQFSLARLCVFSSSWLLAYQMFILYFYAAKQQAVNFIPFHFCEIDISSEFETLHEMHSGFNLQ